MNPDKRHFLRTGAAVLASLALAPLPVIAAEREPVILHLTGYGPKTKRSEKVVLEGKTTNRLRQLQGKSRADFLADQIITWLKQQFPGVSWGVIERDFTIELTKKLIHRLRENEVYEGPSPVAGMEIKAEFRFLPLDRWKMNLEMRLPPR